MIVGALDPSLTMSNISSNVLQVLTRHGFVEHGMVLLFFPSMAAGAACLLGATFVVFSYECAWLPILTNLVRIVVVDVGLSSEVLPIVRIHALRLVVLLVEWAPLSLEIEHVKVCILGHFVDESRLQLFGTMRKGTVVSVIAFVQVLRILGAIF